MIERVHTIQKMENNIWKLNVLKMSDKVHPKCLVEKSERKKCKIAKKCIIPSNT